MTQTRPPDEPLDRDPRPGAAPVGEAAVLDLAMYHADRPTRILDGLRAHWRALCAGRAVPDRADVTPEGLGPALDYAFILERVAPGSARLRLAGRHLIDLMGMEVRGMPISALLNPGYRGRLADVLETVFQAPQLAELFLLAPQGPMVPACPARMLLMPLKSDLGDVTRVLGCLVSDCQPGPAPRRFDLISERFEPVIAGAPVLAPRPGPDPAPTAAPRMPAQGRDAAPGPGKCASTAPDRNPPAHRGNRRPPAPDGAEDVLWSAARPSAGRAQTDPGQTVRDQTDRDQTGPDPAGSGQAGRGQPVTRQSPPVGHPGWQPRLVVDNGVRGR